MTSISLALFLFVSAHATSFCDNDLVPHFSLTAKQLCAGDVAAKDNSSYTCSFEKDESSFRICYHDQGGLLDAEDLLFTFTEKLDWTTEVVGYTAGVLLTLCLLPQLQSLLNVKFLKTSERAYDWTYMYTAALALMVTYLVKVNANAGKLTLGVALSISVIISIAKLSKGSPKKETHVEKVRSFDGHHILLDYHLPKDEDPQVLADWMLKTMAKIVGDHNIKLIHKHMEVFDGVTSPPGFASGVLLHPRGQITAHCYSVLQDN